MKEFSYRGAGRLLEPDASIVTDEGERLRTGSREDAIPQIAAGAGKALSGFSSEKRQHFGIDPRQRFVVRVGQRIGR